MDRVSVKATAITAGAGSLVADKAQHTAPEVVTWLGITVVDWAAIASIALTALIFGEKIVRFGVKAYRCNKNNNIKDKGGNDEL